MIPFRAMLSRFALLLAAASFAHAGGYTKTEQSSRLYTAPDSSAAGGIRVRFKATGAPMGVFALNQTDANHCYRGTADGGGWIFKGLPVAKYDLVVVFDNRFYEGLVLSHETNSLTPADQISITNIIHSSVPFFEIKKVYRMEGATGHEGKCSIVFQELRARPVTLQSAEVRNDIQIRSLKMGFLEQVNIGWQLINTREIMRIEVGGGMPKGLIAHTFVKELGNTRVTDSIKDLGEIRLD